MKISVALASYNGEKYIADQIHSIINQTLPPDELVVVDDGSVDRTCEIIESLKSQYRAVTIRLFRNNETLGYTKNFKRAISLCAGDLIFLADQDDIWFPYKISQVRKQCTANKEALFVHDAFLVDEDLKWYGASVFSQAQVIYGGCGNVNTGALTAFTAAYKGYISEIPENLVGHDIWLHEIATALAQKVILNVPLQIVRRHKTNTSKWLASEIHPLNAKTIFFSRLASIPATNYEQNFILAKGVSDLFDRPSRNDRDGSDADLNEVSGRYLQIYEAFVQRDEVARHSGVSAKVKTIRLMFNGAYKYVGGWRSIVRDLTR